MTGLPTLSPTYAFKPPRLSRSNSHLRLVIHTLERCLKTQRLGSCFCKTYLRVRLEYGILKGSETLLWVQDTTVFQKFCLNSFHLGSHCYSPSPPTQFLSGRWALLPICMVSMAELTYQIITRHHVMSSKPCMSQPAYYMSSSPATSASTILSFQLPRGHSSTPSPLPHFPLNMVFPWPEEVFSFLPIKIHRFLSFLGPLLSHYSLF